LVAKEPQNKDIPKRKTARERIWNIASIAFGGIAIAYGLVTEQHFATAAGAVIAAIGSFRLVKERGRA
jgi:hypothetical protein